MWDAYGNDSANEGYAISQITSATSLPNEFYNYDIMKDAYRNAKTDRSENVSANDIEMMLEAFSENDWQYFYQGHCRYIYRSEDQKLSRAIKHPKPTYEKKRKTGNWDYYYWNRDSEKIIFIGNSYGFPANWIP